MVSAIKKVGGDIHTDINEHKNDTVFNSSMHTYTKRV